MEIELRPTTENDLSYVLSAERNAENSLFVIVWSEGQHRAALSDANIEHLIIESRPDNRCVGFAILAGLLGGNRSIEFVRIVVTDKGRGYGRAAVRAIKKRSFEVLSAHRLWLDVKELNTRAQAVYEKEGFRYEGTLRECLRNPDGFESLLVMSVLEQEYADSLSAD